MSALQPVSFRLTEDELARMDALASEQGLPHRVDLLRRAVSEYDARHSRKTTGTRLMGILAYVGPRTRIRASVRTGSDDSGRWVAVDIEATQTHPDGDGSEFSQNFRPMATVDDQDRVSIHLASVDGYFAPILLATVPYMDTVVEASLIRLISVDDPAPYMPIRVQSTHPAPSATTPVPTT